MRAVVTGGAGFIGSNLARHLINAGDDVVVVDALTYAGTLTSLTDLDSHPRFEFIHADIRDGDRMRGVLTAFRPEVVIHLAAETHVDRSIDGPADFIETNVVGTATLLEAATAYWSARQPNRFRFHHVSTDEVFGSLGDQGRFGPESRYAPRSPYAASKASSDHFVSAWHETYGLPTVISNCSNNYGPWQFPEKLIPHMIIRALAGESLPVYGTGKNVRDWLYVDDHARALRLIAENGRIGGTYLVGGAAERTNLAVVEALCGVLDDLLPNSPHRPHHRLITFVQDRPGHDHRYAIDASATTLELGWRPTVDFETGLRMTVRWYLEHRTWWEKLLQSGYRTARLGLGPSDRPLEG